MRAIDKQTVRSALAQLEPRRAANRGVAVASFAGFDADGRFQIRMRGRSDPLTAISAVPLTAGDIGVPVIVAYEDEQSRPVILGRVQERAPAAQATADGTRLVIRAEREIELRCGDASIILTRAGKVLIRGNHVVSRSRGANKVKGAHVDIN